VDRFIVSFGKAAPDYEPVPYTHIIDLCGFDFALLAMRAEPAYDIHWRSFAVWCAKRVRRLVKDECALAAIDAAEKFIAAEPYGSQKMLEEAHSRALAACREINWAAELERGTAAAVAAANTANADAAEGAKFCSYAAAIASPKGFLEERVRQCARFRKICATEN
jgi:hypothetical protein